jgi:hypothetical protein
MNWKVWLERWNPLLGGVIAAAVSWHYFPVFPVPADSAPSLFSAIVSLSAISVGFLATAKAILFSIDQTLIVRQLQANVHYSRLVDFLLSAIHWSFALAIFSAGCFTVDLKNSVSWHRYYLTVWVFVLAAASLATYRVIHIFGALLRDQGRRA